MNQSFTYGTYVMCPATCVICNQQYAGHATRNKISTRWSSYRSNLNKPENKDDNDQLAISRHYSVFYDIINKPPTHKALTVTFVEQPSVYTLDACEDNDCKNVTQSLYSKHDSTHL